jgi:hypothetical protein
MTLLVHEPSSFWFSGHESFRLRHAWLPKAIAEVKKHPDIFQRDEALVWLGVGKNMVRSIRHWALATGVLSEGTFRDGTRIRTISPTDLGVLLFGDGGVDPYLEDPATLWLLHWNLSCHRAGPTMWWWMFNELQDAEFTKDRVLRALHKLIELAGGKPISQNSLSRDFDCFVGTYLSKNEPGNGISEEALECPLTDLGLLQELDEGVLAFNRSEHPSLPSAVVAYATLDYWERIAAHKNTLTFDQLAYQPGSPGRIFRLTENALSEHLDSMEKLTRKIVTYDVTAGLRQLYRRQSVDKLPLLRRYFDGNSGGN